ncbi:MAG: glycosyltransferase family 4 protein [Candidatus Woesearchaeota archaeon]
MHVLMIGLDNTVFTQEGRGDLANRLKKYAEHVDFISLVIYTQDKGFKPVNIADNVMAYPTNSKYQFRFPWQAAKIGAEIHKERPVNLVTTQDPFVCGYAGWLMKKRFGIPLVVNIFSSFFDDQFWKREDWKNPFFNIFGKWLIKKADGVRVECDTEREKVISLGVSAEKVKVAPVLVDLKKFSDEKGSVREKYIDGYDRIVLFIGRLSVEKNVGLLIKAAKVVAQKRPKTLFLIVGGGKDEINLKSMAADCKNILFTGRIPHADIPKYHKAADVLVLPSFYEGIPLVVVEAAAAGLPVICTDVRDAKDVIIEGKSGFIVPKDNPDILALRILDVLEDPKKAKEMGKIGQKLVMEKFDPEKNLKDCLDLWRQVAK